MSDETNTIKFLWWAMAALASLVIAARAQLYINMKNTDDRQDQQIHEIYQATSRLTAQQEAILQRIERLESHK